MYVAWQPYAVSKIKYFQGKWGNVKYKACKNYSAGTFSRWKKIQAKDAYTPT